ncbi:MAG: hypothetical protein WD733_25255 [Bryobacterales bacterium]
MEEAAGGAAPSAGGYTPPPGPGSPPAGSYSGAQSEGGLSDNVAGALAYFTIIPAIIFLLVDPFKTRRFVRFHAFQCLFLGAAAFAIWIVFAVLATSLAFFGGGLIIGMLSFLVQIGLIVVWFIVVIKAYQGQEFRLPVLGDLAAKQV